MEQKYIGIDLHREFFQTCAAEGEGTRMWEGRFPRTENRLDTVHCNIGAGSKALRGHDDQRRIRGDRRNYFSTNAQLSS
jgi:hypothetical protein